MLGAAIAIDSHNLLSVRHDSRFDRGRAGAIGYDGVVTDSFLIEQGKHGLPFVVVANQGAEIDLNADVTEISSNVARAS